MYIHDKIAINSYLTYDDNISQGVICLSKTHKCVIICIYRPPTSGLESFSNLLTFISDFLAEFNSNNELSTFLFGDFNLPKFNWKLPNCNSLLISESLYKQLIMFMNEHFFSQYVTDFTRGENILDLFLTENPNFVHFIKCEDISLSDHYLVRIYTNFFRGLDTDLHRRPVASLELLNFSAFDLDGADFDQINRELESVDWENFVNEVSVEDFPQKFQFKVYSILQKHFLLKYSNKM